MYEGRNYVHGWQAHRKDFVKIDPCTEEHLGEFPKSTKQEVDDACALARREFPAWRAKSRIQRAEYFDRLCGILKNKVIEIATNITKETGKTLNESKAEVMEALHMAQYTFGAGRNPTGQIIASELAERDAFIIRKPKGVVGVISPWNFPYAIGGFWCAAPALLEGNTVVFKPSEDAPYCGQMIAELYHEAGFPPGVFNMLHGDGETGSFLVSNPEINHICFTGSAQVGRSIRKTCADFVDKSCSCEMGSKSAVIIFNDADMDLALGAAINSAFKLSGQRCVSAGRILIEHGIYEKFCNKFAEAASRVKTGHPSDPNVFYGPLINKSQRDRVESFNQLVRDDQRKILLNAHREGDKGYYLSPMVYQSEWSNSLYLKQEVFGPHVALIPFVDMNDAIRIYNDTNYGLAMGCVTNNYRTMREMRERCDAGLMYFNLGCIGAESHSVFGGVKGSGYGGASAAGTFDAVTHKVAVSVNHGQSINFPQGMK